MLAQGFENVDFHISTRRIVRFGTIDKEEVPLHCMEMVMYRYMLTLHVWVGFAAFFAVASGVVRTAHLQAHVESRAAWHGDGFDDSGRDPAPCDVEHAGRAHERPGTAYHHHLPCEPERPSGDGHPVDCEFCFDLLLSTHAFLAVNGSSLDPCCACVTHDELPVTFHACGVGRRIAPRAPPFFS